MAVSSDQEIHDGLSASHFSPEASDAEVMLPNLQTSTYGDLSTKIQAFTRFGVQFGSGFDLLLRRRQETRRIQNESQLRGHVDERGEQRVEEAEGGKDDAERIDRDRAGEVLPDDAPRPARDAQASRRSATRSLPSSTTSALSRATSVPEPIATPTLASASAGASLTPSPTMATMRPSPSTSVRTRASLSSGSRFGRDLVDAELRADGVGDRRGIAGEQDRADAHRVERRDGALGLGPHGIGDSDRAEQSWPSRATKTSDARLSSLASRRRGTAMPWSCIRPDCRRERLRRPPGPRCRGPACSRTLGLCDRAALRARIGDDRLAERMLGAQLGRRGRVQQLSAITPSSGNERCTSGRPKVSVPVLSRTTVSTRPKRFEIARRPSRSRPDARARPMPPRMASGVPAAMPQAPATMIDRDRGDDVAGDQERERARRRGRSRRDSRPAGRPGAGPARASARRCSTASMILP